MHATCHRGDIWTHNLNRQFLSGVQRISPFYSHVPTNSVARIEILDHLPTFEPIFLVDFMLNNTQIH